MDRVTQRHHVTHMVQVVNVEVLKDVRLSESG